MAADQLVGAPTETRAGHRTELAEDAGGYANKWTVQPSLLVVAE